MTSDSALFLTEDRMHADTGTCCEALLRALQREHPRIVAHLQLQALANKKTHQDKY